MFNGHASNHRRASSDFLCGLEKTKPALQILTRACKDLSSPARHESTLLTHSFRHIDAAWRTTAVPSVLGPPPSPSPARPAPHRARPNYMSTLRTCIRVLAGLAVYVTWCDEMK